MPGAEDEPHEDEGDDDDEEDDEEEGEEVGEQEYSDDEMTEAEVSEAEVSEISDSEEPRAVDEGGGDGGANLLPSRAKEEFRLYAAAGIDSHQRITFNFGESPFLYDPALVHSSWDASLFQSQSCSRWKLEIFGESDLDDLFDDLSQDSDSEQSNLSDDL